MNTKCEENNKPRDVKNLVGKPRNVISRELENRLKLKVRVKIIIELLSLAQNTSTKSKPWGKAFH